MSHHMELFNNILDLCFVEGMNLRECDLPRSIHHHPLTVVVFACVSGTQLSIPAAFTSVGTR